MTNEHDFASARRTAASIYETLRVFELEAKVLLARYGYQPASVVATTSVLGDWASKAIKGALSVLPASGEQQGGVGKELEAVLRELTRLGCAGSSQAIASERLAVGGERLEHSLADIKFRLAAAVRVNSAIDEKLEALSSALDCYEGGLVQSPTAASRR